MAATQGIYVPYLDFSSLENIDGWFSTKTLFVPDAVVSSPLIHSVFHTQLKVTQIIETVQFVNQSCFILQKNENVPTQTILKVNNDLDPLIHSVTASDKQQD